MHIVLTKILFLCSDIMLNKLSKATSYLTYQHCFYIGIVAFAALPHDSYLKYYICRPIYYDEDDISDLDRKQIQRDANCKQKDKKKVLS